MNTVLMTIVCVKKDVEWNQLLQNHRNLVCMWYRQFDLQVILQLSESPNSSQVESARMMGLRMNDQVLRYQSNQTIVSSEVMTSQLDHLE